MAQSTTQRIFLGHIKGEKGDQGDPATVTIGTVGTTAPGGNAEVIPGGTPQDLVLNFVLPRGEPGTGAGAAITALRSNACPLVHRIPIDNVVGKAMKNDGYYQVFGAIDLLHWVPNSWVGNTRKTRVDYFTSHPTRGIMQGWERTAYSPYMEVFFNGHEGAPMLWPLDAPINFQTLGYRGNWARSHIYYDEYFDSPKSSFFVAGTDYDGLVFTNSNRALWMRGRGGYSYIQQRTAIDLVGLANAAITSMWAGITFEDNRIWVIQQNRLMLCHIINSSSATYQQPGSAIGRRLNSPADFPFVEVTNASTGNVLPTTMSRVYAEGRYACVWGTTPNNRLAYFNGTNWVALTLPFAINGLANSAIIFASGRLGVFNNQNGDYYTCDNPMAGGAAVFTLRYRVRASMLLTNGFQRGIPQFLPRNESSAGPIYAEFDATTHEGGGCYRNPLHPIDDLIYWPSELYCSNRPDIVPLPGNQGWLYSYGTRTSYTSMFGDGNTVMATANYSPAVWEPPQWKRNEALVPPGLQPPLPIGYLPTPAARFGPVSTVDQRGRSAMMMYAADPGVVAAG